MQNRVWVYAWISFDVVLFHPESALVFSLYFLEVLKLLEENICEGFKGVFIWNVILWKLYLNFVVVATTSGFLTGSFPMEPWTRKNNRERKKKDYENLVVLLSCDFNLGISMWENGMIDNAFELGIFKFSIMLMKGNWYIEVFNSMFEY